MLHAAVFSDTHANTALMLEGVRRFRPDVIFHLGDHERDAERLREAFPEIPLYTVCGNCDFAPEPRLKGLAELGPVKVFYTHGHSYNVNWNLDTLVYAAQEAGARLALFGHTHEALNVEIGGVQLLNPGSAGLGRRPSFGWVTVFDNGGLACEIRELKAD